MIVAVDDGGTHIAILVLGALAAVAFVALFLFVAYPYLFGDRRRPRLGYRKPFLVHPAPQAAASTSPVGDSADQLRHVMGAAFQKKKVMSGGEYKVFKLIETEITALRNGCRVLSQTSLGEVIYSKNKEAHASINSKRVDILIIDSSGYPLAAVEVQGAGHYQGMAAARDAVKKEALRKAGVQYIEVMESHSSDEILRSVRKLFPEQRPPGPWSQPISV